MILYKAIKYSILDYCLNSICDSVLKNFSRLNGHIQILRIEDLAPGMYIKRMEFEDYGFWWTNVTILNVGKLQDPAYNVDYNIYFSFHETNFDRRTIDEDGKELLALDSLEPVRIEI